MENEKDSSSEVFSNSNDSLKAIEETVDELIKYRDCYFEYHPLEEANLKHERVQEKLDETLKFLEQRKDDALKCNRARYFYNLGRAYNVLTPYSKEAEESLMKAVKLDPRLVPVWNNLGECYWKKDSKTEAKNSFEKALSLDKNKESLRNLSILVRQETSRTKEELVKKTEEGISFAHQAVQLDPNDGLSWSILGNAYITLYFTVNQNPKILKQAMSAYIQAEKDVVMKDSPDLHYNKAIVLKYQEEFEAALISYNKSIERDPTWSLSSLKRQQILTYLDELCDMIKSKGRLKAKKINNLVQSIDNKHLGPYAGETYTNSTGQSFKLQYALLAELVKGINIEKVVIGKVICSVRDEDNVPFTFCLMDKAKNVVAVTVYNLAVGKGVIIGDSVSIPEPYLNQYEFMFSNKAYKFNIIRVDNPLVLVVNGKYLARDNLASTQLSTFKMTQ